MAEAIITITDTNIETNEITLDVLLKVEDQQAPATMAMVLAVYITHAIRSEGLMDRAIEFSSRVTETDDGTTQS